MRNRGGPRADNPETVSGGHRVAPRSPACAPELPEICTCAVSFGQSADITAPPRVCTGRGAQESAQARQELMRELTRSLLALKEALGFLGGCTKAAELGRSLRGPANSHPHNGVKARRQLSTGSRHCSPPWTARPRIYLHSSTLGRKSQSLTRGTIIAPDPRRVSRPESAHHPLLMARLRPAAPGSGSAPLHTYLHS